MSTTGPDERRAANRARWRRRAAAWDRTAGEVEGTEKPELPEADACA